MDNETPTKPFDHVMWSVTLTAFDWNDDGTDWTDNGTPLDKYDLTFAYLQHALDYMRSWTTDTARTIMAEAGRGGLEIGVHKEFYLTSSDDSFDGRIPFVAVTVYSLDGNAIECMKDYYEDAVHSVSW